MAKKVTIEDLAHMMKKGFDESATKVDIKGINERLGKIELRIAKIDAILLAVHKGRLDKLEDRMGDIEDRICAR